MWRVSLPIVSAFCESHEETASGYNGENYKFAKLQHLGFKVGLLASRSQCHYPSLRKEKKVQAANRINWGEVTHTSLFLAFALPQKVSHEKSLCFNKTKKQTENNMAFTALLSFDPPPQKKKKSGSGIVMGPAASSLVWYFRTLIKLCLSFFFFFPRLTCVGRQKTRQGKKKKGKSGASWLTGEGNKSVFSWWLTYWFGNVGRSTWGHDIYISVEEIHLNIGCVYIYVESPENHSYCMFTLQVAYCAPALRSGRKRLSSLDVFSPNIMYIAVSIPIILF